MSDTAKAGRPPGALRRLFTGSTEAQCRDTGLALVLIVLLVVYFGGRHSLVPLALALLVLTMVWPRIFRPLAGLWFGLSHLLGTVVSKVVLSILFFVLVTPLGWLRRWLGADPLQLKSWKKNRDSVFVVRGEVITPKDLDRPY